MKTINVAVASPDDEVQVIRPTPQHDRLKEVRPISQALHEFFLEFLSEKGIELATYSEDQNRLVNAGRPEKLIAEFLEIDLDELENEKRRMLIDMRTADAKRNAEKELPLVGRKKG